MTMVKKILRGASMASAVLLAASITCGAVMEVYPAQLDAAMNTLSSRVISDEADWEKYSSKFTTAKDAFEGYKEFAIRASRETFALLKNNDVGGKPALPLSKTASITLMGLRSYTPVYGNSGGSISDLKTVAEGGNKIYEAFKGRGFKLNPSMQQTYENYVNTGKDGGPFTWAPGSFGASPPEYGELNTTDAIHELGKAELAQYNANYASEYAQYNDAAIVVFGRPGGESKNYIPGDQTLTTANRDGTTTVTEGLQDTTTGNIFGLSTEEKEVLEEAKANFDKVIVLINSACQMEIKELEEDPDVAAVMWIGYPGAYGFWGVADVLNGTVSPSGHLGDVYAANTAVNPAMQNFGMETAWTNADALMGANNVNTYLVEAEGIYTGYRYYETRYEDYVLGQGNAATASAGTYVNADTTEAATAGEWDYDNEVVYPFGHGLSYTTFTQTLDSVQLSADKKSATVTVTVKNSANGVKGKSVVQLYAQSPYTQYDKTNKVEKASVQLMDFEKTDELAPGASQTITMNVDLANLASYDYTNAETFIMDNHGDYYFAIGDDSHDALNNILAAKGLTPEQEARMSGTGDADKTYKFNWNDAATTDVDDVTFSTSDNGTKITNRLTEGESAMDYNYFEPGKVTYLSRSDWNGTYPKTYAGLSARATEELYKLLSCDFYTLKTNDDVSEFKWGVDGDLTLHDMFQADWDDPRWAQIVDQVTIDEFLNFASHAFHNIAEIPSVGYDGNNADDGPNGSDTHYFEEGSYKGTPYADAQDYNGYGTRVGPSATNLAYSWNKEIAYENGEIILGETSLILSLPIIIGPGMNLHRHAYNGRGSEYYSEDPILSGYIGSAIVQGAQSKGCLVNIKHAAFNDQEINRSGIAVFMNEQKARELELRNLQQAFEAKGKPASFVADSDRAETYKLGALGVMSSYNRIGATPPSANKGVMVDIMRGEWGFKGYNVTDFTSVSLKAAPKESILYGTTAFCGFGVQGIDYWSADALENDAAMCAAIKQDIKYVLYSLANSSAAIGYRVQLNSTWRVLYKTLEGVFGALTGLLVCGWIALEVLEIVKKKKNPDGGNA